MTVPIFRKSQSSSLPALRLPMAHGLFRPMMRAYNEFALTLDAMYAFAAPLIAVVAFVAVAGIGVWAMLGLAGTNL